MCPNNGCKAIGHIDCWSKDALYHEGGSEVLPDISTCPSCGGEIRWGDMMKELSLRVRGPQDVEKLLKKAEKAKKAAKVT
jgi:structure-specific endonuclease subunit SLX1